MTTNNRILTLKDFKHSGVDVSNSIDYGDYSLISWIYACVNRVATSAAGAPLIFYEGDTTNEHKRIIDPESDVMRLFSPPNPPQIASLRDLINRTFIHLGIRGQIFWIFSNESGGAAFDTISTRSALKPILRDPATNKTYYSEGNTGYGVGNNETLELVGWYNRLGAKDNIEIFDPEVVLPILYYNPYNVYTGLSPLHAANISINAEKKISSWNSAFFKIGMKNPIIIKSKGTLTSEQKAELRKEIVNYYSGIEGGQGALLLGGNVDFEEVKISSKDVDFIKGKELNREEIAAIYGVPPALLGIFNYSNYSNTREQRQLFWENTLLPQLNLIKDLIQVNILNNVFPGVICKWDIDAIPGIAADPVLSSKSAVEYFSMGVPIEVIGAMLKIPELASLKESDLIEREEAEPVEMPADDSDDGEQVSEEDEAKSISLSKLAISAELQLKSMVPIVGARLFNIDENALKKDLFVELLLSQTYSILARAAKGACVILSVQDFEESELKRKTMFENVSEFLYYKNQKIKNKDLLTDYLLAFCLEELQKVVPLRK